MAVSNRKIRLGIFVAVLLSFGTMQAQGPLPIHPGYTIKLKVKFDGPDASKIKNVSLYIGSKTGTLPHDQPNFTNGWRGGNFPPVASATFEPELTIPPNLASGDYVLTVTASAEIGSADYKAGEQFSLRDYRVENSTTLIPPKITVEERH